jgi:hypothetical protein
MISCIALVLLYQGLSNVIQNSKDLLELETYRSLSTAIKLSFVSILFLYFSHAYSMYEKAYAMLKLHHKEKSIKKILFLAVINFHFKSDLIESFIHYIVRANNTNEREIIDLIRKVKNLSKQEKERNHLDCTTGWDVENAKGFLTDYGLQINSYREHEDYWSADCCTNIENDNFNIMGTLYYRIEGDFEKVTQITFKLHYHEYGNTDKEECIFRTALKKLINCAVNINDISDDLFQVRNNETRVLSDNTQYHLTQNTWNNADVGYTERKVILRKII